jgi:hypothetical protein
MSYILPLTAEDVERRLLKVTDLSVHEAVHDKLNILVKLDNHFIEDGSEIKFRAPVSCSEVTRLHVQYEGEHGTETKVFAFADANGNDIGKVNNLFAAGAIVKVVLDLEPTIEGIAEDVDGAAFVQNADTNKYLEDRLARLAASIGGGTGGGGQAAFVATYNETSLDDIYNAYLEGKDIILKDIDGGYLAVPVSITQTAAMFTTTLGLAAWSYTVLETGWNKVQHSLESSDNKEINLIDGSFNHNTYPSSKAVVDYFNKNRTHYTEGTGPSLSKVIENSDNTMLNGELASKIGDIKQDITNGKISIDGNIYDFSVDKCFATEKYSICVVPQLSNPATSTNTIYIKAIKLSNGSAAYLPVGTKVEIYLPDESPLVVHQLDEKYIPDSIARTSYISEQISQKSQVQIITWEADD